MSTFCCLIYCAHGLFVQSIIDITTLAVQKRLYEIAEYVKKKLTLAVIIAVIFAMLNCTFNQLYGIQSITNVINITCVLLFMKLNDKPRPKLEFGKGMALSFFVGYLNHVLPNHGMRDGYGMDEVIKKYEAVHAVQFAVKKLFIVIPKSSYCPPALTGLNRGGKNDLEMCTDPHIHEKEVGGSRRSYKTPIYKIVRPDAPTAPVFLAVEGATPLITLHRVKQSKACKGMNESDFDEIREEFTASLDDILKRSSDCKDKYILVNFDDANRKENLADVLLKKINEIEPNFEDLIARKHECLGEVSID